MSLALAMLVALAFAAFGFALRARGMAAQRGQGGDAWYYLLYVEELRRSRRIPPHLPYFLLDIPEQWYPPAFPVFLSLLPEDLVKRHRWAIAPGVDCLQLLVLALFTFLATRSIASTAVAAAIYATTPTLIAENLNLNSRSFGSLLFTFTMLSLHVTESNGSPLGWLALAVCGGVLLLTHKLSSQALAFVLVAEALVTQRWAPLLAQAACLAMAFLLSRGFFLKVLRGHWDILRYWRKNLHDLGAHQVYDSPLYASRAPAGPSPRFHAPGLGGLMRHAKVLLSHNPYALALPLLLWGEAATSWYGFCLRWVIWIYLWALATTFIRPLRFLGEGVRYLKLVAFPLSFLLGVWAQGVLGLLVGLLAALALYVILKKVQHAQWGRADEGLSKVAEYLRRAEPGGVLALPAHAADAIAYLARREVMWGAHSSGYEKLEPFFPVLRRPVQAFFEEYSLRFLLIDSGYVRPEALGLQSFRMVLEEGSYQLYRYQGTRPAQGDRAEALSTVLPSEAGREGGGG